MRIRKNSVNKTIPIDAHSLNYDMILILRILFYVGYLYIEKNFNFNF